MSTPTVTAPVIERPYGLSPANEQVEVEDRRMTERRSCALTGTLRSTDDAPIGPCSASNISEGGVRLSVPAGAGVKVGQRYEVCLFQERPGMASPRIVCDGEYGTVVRTEPGDLRSRNLVQAALCFDQPLFL